MKLQILRSSSKGNCYIFTSESGESLIVECGVNFKKIQKALDFDYSKVVGCLVSHEHKDHSRSVKDVLKAGIKIIASTGTLIAEGISAHYNVSSLSLTNNCQLGYYQVKSFDVKHDAEEPLGFIIRHHEMGTTLFLTDTYYCEYKFPGLNNILIEANYSQEIIDKKLSNGALPTFLRDRVLQSHMSLETCTDLLRSNDLSQVNNIVLIHLSDSNSDEKAFKKHIERVTGKTTTIANEGIVIENFNINPF